MKGMKLVFVAAVICREPKFVCDHSGSDIRWSGQLKWWDFFNKRSPGCRFWSYPFFREN